ncbi:MAG: hypothetical protein K2O33_07545, partial [Muribaculaceae bacterium]|nr:hypothetical protein [Muribaculaceae bacterium]
VDAGCFTFTSSNPGVASYDAAAGTLTLLGAGKATISATLTEEAALLYKMSDDSKTTIDVTVTDINGPIGYERVTSLDQITDEDYYTIAANYDGKTYAMSGKTVTSTQIDAVVATIKDGMIEYGDSTILKLKFTLSEKTTNANKYSITTVNLETNGTLSATDKTDLNIQSNSTSVGTTSFDKDGYVKINFAGTRQILFYKSNIFKHYASSNATSTGYAPVSLYRLNFVKAEAPEVSEFEGMTVGDVVEFTAKHSTHKLEYREWFRSKAVSRAEAEIQYGEWAPVNGSVHAHTIKALEEGIAEHGVQVRALDTRGNYSNAVGFSYDGDKTITGIESVAAEAEGEGELYNLQGVRVDRRSAAPGLYIERRGGKAVKVIL